MFFHYLKNSDDREIEVLVQEYFAESFKPYLHELKIVVTNHNGQEKQISDY